MTRQWFWSGVLLALLPSLSAAQQSTDADLPLQLDKTRVQLERALLDHQRCTQDYAELFVQARRLQMAFEQQKQELATVKGPAPAPPPLPAPSSSSVPEPTPPASTAGR